MTYTLPAVIDPENDACIISKVAGANSLVSFVNPNILDFHPTFGSAGSHTVVLQISDGVNNPTFTVNFQVIAPSGNSKPTFVTTPVSQITPAGTPKTYVLPATTDLENDPITIAMVNGPSFVTFTPPGTLNINPSSNDVNLYTV